MRLVMRLMAFLLGVIMPVLAGIAVIVSGWNLCNSPDPVLHEMWLRQTKTGSALFVLTLFFAYKLFDDWRSPSLYRRRRKKGGLGEHRTRSSEPN